MPINLGWLNNQTSALEIQTSVIGNDSNNIQSKDDADDGSKVEEPKACRASNRLKKTILEKNRQCLWKI
jgi:hypothetical protein